MRIYIVEDDISVIHILEDIVESGDLGEICGDCGGEPADVHEVLRARPDVVLVDFFMPVMDGVEFVRELRSFNNTIKCIMISQVSAKELISKAYTAGVDFFISKPINLIEVTSVLKNVAKQIQNERTLDNIRHMFMNEIGQKPQNSRESSSYSKKLRYILNRIGMSGEKGCSDILKICDYLHRERIPVSQMSVAPAVRGRQRFSEKHGAAGPPGYRCRNGQCGPHGHRGLYERNLYHLLLHPVFL